MKDSGIYDGVEIPVSWDTMKFGKVCSVVTDFVASGSFADLRENVPYLSEPDYAMLVRTTDLAKTARSEGKVYISKASYEFLSNSNLFGGEIVLPNIGSIGDVYVVPKLYDRMSLAPNSIMFKTNYCDKYYYYYFLSKVGGLQLSEISQSTAMAKFNKTDLKQIRVFLPSLAEQQRIAEFLDRKCGEIDEMISLQEKVIEELKAYKQSIITEAVTKGLNPNVAMRDSEIEWIGEIPEHWEVKRLKFALDGLCDGTHGTFDRVNNGELLLSAKNIGEKGIVLGDNESQISHEDYTKIISNGFPCKGDVLLCCVGTIGKCSIFNEDKPIAFQRSVAFLRHNRTMTPEYLMYLLKSNIMQAQYEMYARKSAQSGIYMGVIKDFVIVAPYITEQQAIADYLDKKCADIDSLIQTKQSKIEELKEYKKSLIYEYVTGKKEI
jgi:type I restriction enzyme S subunit